MRTIATIGLALAVALAGCQTFHAATAAKAKADALVVQYATPSNVARACATIAAGEDIVLLQASTGTLHAAELRAVRAGIPVKARYCNVKPMPPVPQSAYTVLRDAANASNAVRGLPPIGDTP